MFLENKYTRWYQTIINEAQNQKRIRQTDDYYESHHIIPKCMGGTEEVLLTAKEHFICHLLLCRMLEGSDKHKMINALIKMAYSKSNGQKRYTARSFSLVRKLIAEKNREMFKGKPKKHTNNGLTGTWERTKKHRQMLSDQRKGKQSGEDNPFFGKTHSAKTKREWSKKRKGRVTRGSTGMKWYNDGVRNTMAFENKVDRNIWKYEGRTK